MLAISTSWNAKGRTDIENILREIKNLGLDTVEIGYTFPPVKIQELLSWLPRLGMKACSVHNFCPLPDDAPSLRHVSNYYRLSAIDEEERRKAVAWTKRSVDTARESGCSVVVIHAGDVVIPEMPYRTLIDMYEQGKGQTAAFAETRVQYLKLRRVYADPYIAAVEKSLKEILDYAASCSIVIGLENRFYPHEIPNLEETGYFLSRLGTQGLVYWHDTGHAQAHEAMGVSGQEDFLKLNQKYLYGSHLHDVIGIEDHLAPFCGHIDFDRIFSYFSKEVIRVIEAHPPASAEQVRAAVKKLS